VVVGDDEGALADPGPARGGGERLRAGERMPTASLGREVGELVDAEERRAGNVLVQIGLAPRFDAVEGVRAVDESILDQ
jgi:hypothetical protein